jgi:hypothetical protein
MTKGFGPVSKEAKAVAFGCAFAFWDIIIVSSCVELPADYRGCLHPVDAWSSETSSASSSGQLKCPSTQLPEYSHLQLSQQI